MTTKEYLEQIRYMDYAINDMLSERRELRELATKIGVGEQNPDKVQSSGVNDKVARIVVKLADIETELDRRIDEYADLKDRIRAEINELNPNVATILIMRYVSCENFNTIAKTTKYTWRHVMRLHGQGLAAFERLHGQKYLNISKKY